MSENILQDYAVVENGIITNVLVFDNENTAKEFGCFPLAFGQGIGDTYMAPEEYSVKTFRDGVMEMIDSV